MKDVVNLRASTRKKLIAPIMVVAVLIIAATSTSVVSAHRGAGSDDMATRLSERFGVPKEDVQNVFDEAKADHFAQMQEKMEERLNESNSTDEQKSQLLALHADHVADFDSYSSLTPEEKRELKEEHRNEMKIWLDENGLEKGDIMPFFGKAHSKGHKGFMFGKHFAK